MTTACHETGELTRAEPGVARIALLGNPNTGKTTLFNRLCGLRQKTSNFPGTTQDARVGSARIGCRDGEGDQDENHGVCVAELIDLPGIYSLELSMPESRVCRGVLAGELAPSGERVSAPDAVCVVADATALGRNLPLLGESLRRRLPMVLAINMIDLARKQGISVNAQRLERELGCPVVLCSARSGEGLGALAEALARPRVATQTPPSDSRGLRDWARDLHRRVVTGTPGVAGEQLTDHLDRALTHPVLGVALFAAIMTALFWIIFKLATYPMGWIDWIFSVLGGAIESAMPAGLLRDLLTGGVVNGLGAVVIFVPQICLLFFLISLLEDTGYLARAALLMDRVLRPFGLPGQAFVPLLSSHACALPGIMACKGIPDRRQRLTTILIAPFMTCTARIPVYVLLVGILFPGRPGMQAIAFTGCYVLGAVAGLVTSTLLRGTILRGRARPLALELPTYKLPSLRTAALTMLDRATVFLKNAGTAILAICIALWWLETYPHVEPPAQVIELRERAAAEADPARSAALIEQADRLQTTDARSRSFIGRIGRTIQPVFEPLGYDWRLSVGVLTSFAAREVFVSTMAVMVSGDEEIEGESLRKTIASATRDDGTPIFTRATSWSLLVYYVLAMQCLPTLAVTAREAGGVRWALLQLGWMSGLAYVLALLVRLVVG